MLSPNLCSSTRSPPPHIPARWWGGTRALLELPALRLSPPSDPSPRGSRSQGGPPSPTWLQLQRLSIKSRVFEGELWPSSRHCLSRLLRRRSSECSWWWRCSLPPLCIGWRRTAPSRAGCSAMAGEPRPLPGRWAGPQRLRPLVFPSPASRPVRRGFFF